MKTTAILLSILVSAQLYASQLQLPPILQVDKEAQTTLPKGQFVRTGPTIQIAILLDSSNSMDGLIAQAKEQIWNIVNEVSRSNKNGKDVTLQVALYEYGKSTLPISTGYIKMLSPLTNDLDFLSEKLFSLRTMGGSEYAGEGIQKATKDLYWSSHPDDLKLIIIAGNENFDQGTVNYKSAISTAKQNNIIVNTIFCGSHQSGISLNWSYGANIGGGKYMNIDSDAKIVYTPTPYDDKIIILNKKLNDTYIGYGRLGAKHKERQIAEDEKNMNLSKGSFVSRAVSKSTIQYKTESWDAVASYEQGNENIAKELKQSNEAYSDKSEEEINTIVKQQVEDRKEIKEEIQTLEKKRREFKEKNPPIGSKTFGEGIIKEIKSQMQQSGFSFQK